MAMYPSGKIVSSGGKKVSKELKITKEKIKKIHDGLSGWSEAQDAIKDAFPEAFEEEWVDITEEVEWSTDDGHLHGYYKGELLMTASSQRFGVSPISIYCGGGKFKVEHNSDKHTVLKQK